MLRRPVLFLFLLVGIVSACGVESDGGKKCPKALSPGVDLPSLCDGQLDDGFHTGSGGVRGIGGSSGSGGSAWSGSGGGGGLPSEATGGASFGIGGASFGAGGASFGTGGSQGSGGVTSTGGALGLGGEGGESM